MLRPDGLVKVLDFGLAKLTEGQPLHGASGAPTQAQVKSAPGVLMGAIGYMSPEQARGQEVDARTDIFSLGCVLYEMIAGRAPFEGENPADTLAAILHTESPPLPSYALGVTAELERVVAKSLMKDRDHRYQTIEDLLVDLKKFRRQVEGDETKRFVRPDTITDATSTADVGRGASYTAAATAARTGAPSTISSAGHFAAGAMRHQRGMAFIVTALALTTTVAAYFYFTRGGSREINSLAVLPLVNASNDSDIEYLSDGITESLINSLSQLPNLRVMSRNSVFRYKGRDADVREVGRALGVEAVLTGRVTQRGDDLIVSVELADAKNDSHIWGEQYDRKGAGILDVQREISLEVSEKLRARLTGKEQRQVTKNHTDSTEAYELYLKGRYVMRKTTEDDLLKAIGYFQRAIEKDPNYALAYAGMANAYEMMCGPFGYASPKEAAPQAKAAVMRALALDETLDDAHYVLATLKLYHDWDFPGAEREYKRTIELNPNHALAHHDYGTYLEVLGRFDEAVAARERSRRLDPTSPFSIADVGYPLYYARRYDQAIEHYRRGLS